MAVENYFPFTVVKAKYPEKHLIPYEELLMTLEWRNKRETIIAQDNNCCTECNEKATHFFAGKNRRDLTDQEKKEEKLSHEIDSRQEH